MIGLEIEFLIDDESVHLDQYGLNPISTEIPFFAVFDFPRIIRHLVEIFGLEEGKKRPSDGNDSDADGADDADAADDADGADAADAADDADDVDATDDADVVDAADDADDANDGELAERNWQRARGSVRLALMARFIDKFTVLIGLTSSVLQNYFTLPNHKDVTSCVLVLPFVTIPGSLLEAWGATHVIFALAPDPPYHMFDPFDSAELDIRFCCGGQELILGKYIPGKPLMTATFDPEHPFFVSEYLLEFINTMVC